MNRTFTRADLERLAKVLALPGDLAGLTDEQLLDLLAANLLQRKDSLRQSDPAGVALPRFQGGTR